LVPALCTGGGGPLGPGAEVDAVPTISDGVAGGVGKTDGVAPVVGAGVGESLLVERSVLVGESMLVGGSVLVGDAAVVIGAWVGAAGLPALPVRGSAAPATGDPPVEPPEHAVAAVSRTATTHRRDRCNRMSPR